MSDAVIASLAEQRNAILDRPKALLRIPSVFTDPAFASHMQAARDFLLNRLRDGGLQNVQLLDGRGQPTVFAEWLGAQAGGARRVTADRPCAGGTPVTLSG